MYVLFITGCNATQTAVRHSLHCTCLCAHVYTHILRTEYQTSRLEVVDVHVPLCYFLPLCGSVMLLVPDGTPVRYSRNEVTARLISHGERMHASNGRLVYRCHWGTSRSSSTSSGVAVRGDASMLEYVQCTCIQLSAIEHVFMVCHSASYNVAAQASIKALYIVLVRVHVRRWSHWKQLHL